MFNLPSVHFIILFYILEDSDLYFINLSKKMYTFILNMHSSFCGREGPGRKVKFLFRISTFAVMKIFSVRSITLLIGVCFSLTTAMSLPKIHTLPPIPVDCTQVTCSPSQCADEVISPGQCCPECPNGEIR